jgi:transposase
VASRFYRWRKVGVFQHLFDTLKPQADAAGQLNWDVHFVDSPIVRAHQHAAGAKKEMPRPRRSGGAKEA